jgi:hypothetical protein
LTIFSQLVRIKALLSQYLFYIMSPDPQQPQQSPTAMDPNQPQYSSGVQSMYPQDANPYTAQPMQTAQPTMNYDQTAYAQPQYDTYEQSAMDYTTTADYTTPTMGQYPEPTTDFAPAFNNPNLSPSTAISPENMLPQQGLAAEEIPNSFETKKTNQLVIVLGVILVIGLLIATGILVYLNFFRTQQTTTSTTTTSQNQSVQTKDNQPTTEDKIATFDSKLTGGENTPATLARVNSAAVLSPDWLKAKFVSPDVDKDGKCTVENKCAPSADTDLDGLTTLEEQNFGTDPLISDTDLDGLSDGNEVYVYYTNPVKADSDGDTFKDGAEITNCYDPILTPTTPPTKLTQERLSQVTSAIALKPLKDDSMKTLKAAGATSTDLTKGYLSVKCGVLASK